MSELRNQIQSVAVLSAITIVLSGCGGDSSGAGKCYSPTTDVCGRLGVPVSAPEIRASAVGLYKGVTSNGRSIAGLVLDDNSFYSIYSGINNPTVAGGAVHGTIRADSGRYTITDAVDVNLEGLGARIATVVGAYAEKQSINGTISYPVAGQPVSFTANYNTDYETPATIATVAGAYSGTAGTALGSERVAMQIATTGMITGSGASGCGFNGTVTPRATGNAYQVTITFGGAPCRFAGASSSGVAYFDRPAGLAYTVLSVPGENDRFIAVLAKQ